MRVDPNPRVMIAAVTLLLAGFLLPGAAMAGDAAPPAGITGYASLESLLDAARRAQRADLASWSRYRFKRQMVRARLGSDGRVSSRTDVESLVTPLGGPGAQGSGAHRFDELLLRIDSAEPTPGQVSDHRDDAPFTRNYATTIADEGDEGEAGFSLSFLLRMSSYRHDGEELVDGARCHRVRFEADAEAPGDDLSARFARAMAGTLWLTVEGAHVARASVSSIRPVDITFGIVRLSALQVEVTSHPLDAGAWVPHTIETLSTIRFLGIPMRRLTRYSYSDFQPFPPPAPAESAGR